MQDQIQTTETDSGIRFELPTRKSSSFKLLGIGLMTRGAVLAILFYVMSGLMGGFGSSLASTLFTLVGLAFSGLVGLTGYRLFANKTYQAIEFSRGKLNCREILLPKWDWGFDVNCDPVVVTSLTIDTVDPIPSGVLKFFPDAKKVAEEGLQVIHAMSAHGRELSLGHYYPAKVVNELSKELLKELAILPRPEKVSSHGVEVLENGNSVSYILPNRRLGFVRYLAIVPAISAAVILLAILPSLLSLALSSISTFALCALVMSPVLAACGLAIVFGYRLLTNQTQHMVELKNNQIVCYENLWTKYSQIKSKRDTDQVTAIDVLAFETNCSDLDGSKYLARLVSDKFYVAARIPAGNLLMARAYPYETARFLADDIKNRIGLGEEPQEESTGETPIVETAVAAAPNPFVVDMDIVSQQMTNQ